MKARVTNSAPCKLSKGELRRVPLRKTEVAIGYHICCPKCGYVTLALANYEGLLIDESVDGHVTLSAPVRCLFCRVLIHIRRCDLKLEEDEHVRHARYR